MKLWKIGNKVFSINGKSLKFNKARWTPSEITTTAWYDANDSNTISDDEGSVLSWNDKSGNDYNLSSSINHAERPNYSDDSTGKYVSFDGVDDYLGGSLDITSDPNMTIIAMYKEQNIITNKLEYAITIGTNFSNVEPPPLFPPFITTLRKLGYGIGIDGTDRTHATAGIEITYDLIPILDSESTRDPWIMSWKKTSNYQYPTENFYKDGLQMQGESILQDNTRYYIGYEPNPEITLGAFSTGGGYDNFASLDIYEVIILESVDDDLRQKCEGYLAWKWGYESNLPEGHPYKDQVPLSDTKLN